VNDNEDFYSIQYNADEAIAASHFTTPAFIIESQGIYISELDELLAAEASMEQICQWNADDGMGKR
jgi:hypothetical protein